SRAQAANSAANDNERGASPSLAAALGAAFSFPASCPNVWPAHNTIAATRDIANILLIVTLLVQLADHSARMCITKLMARRHKATTVPSRGTWRLPRSGPHEDPSRSTA